MKFGDGQIDSFNLTWTKASSLGRQTQNEINFKASFMEILLQNMLAILIGAKSHKMIAKWNPDIVLKVCIWHGHDI